MITAIIVLATYAILGTMIAYALIKKSNNRTDEYRAESAESLAQIEAYKKSVDSLRGQLDAIQKERMALETPTNIDDIIREADDLNSMLNEVERRR